MKTTEEILEMFPARLVESRTFTYKEKTYFQPYETIYINGEKFNGLRKNTDRGELFDKIIESKNLEYNNYLDVGSNLGFFVHHFSNKFKNVNGVEMEEFYTDMCNNILYPELSGRFINNNLNSKRLSELFTEQFDLITALSMIEYISDKSKFVEDLYNLTKQVCIVEGHSEDISKGLDSVYEKLLRSKDWDVERYSELTEPGTNAPSNSPGRPLWICTKK